MHKTSLNDNHANDKKNTQIKVLCLLNYLPIAGKGHTKEGVYPTILRAHSEAGIEVAVAVQKGKDIAELENTCSQLGVTLIHPRRTFGLGLIGKYINNIKHCSKLTWFDWLLFVWRNRFMLAGVDEYIESKGSPDVIAGFTAIANTGMSAFLIGKRYNIPYVIRENRSHYTRRLIKGKQKSRNKDIIKYAAATFTVSPQLGENIREYLGINVDNMITLQNPVADNFFNQPNDIEWVKSFAKGRFIFAGWTNWRSIKRIDIAIKAFAEVHKKHNETCLIIAGRITHLAWALTLVEKMNLNHVVMLAGHLNRDGIKSLAHGCNSCIVPSDHDPGNNSVLEAMAAGKPVIVTKCGGSESRITDASLGRIAEKGDIMSFASAMEDVLLNINTFNPKHIKNECYRLYSTKAYGSQLISAYKFYLKCI
jgi:glycosyltransferase involved in cell wall biosynthesis